MQQDAFADGAFGKIGFAVAAHIDGGVGQAGFDGIAADAVFNRTLQLEAGKRRVDGGAAPFFVEQALRQRAQVDAEPLAVGNVEFQAAGKAGEQLAAAGAFG